MLLRYLTDLRPSPGERNLTVAYLGVAIFGAVLSFTVVNQLGGGEQLIRPLTVFDWWFIFCGAVGAYFGLYIGRMWLGFPGLIGWCKAVIAIPVISFVAALVGGTLALPGHGTMFGPLGLCTTLIANPLLALFWGTTIIAAHVQFIQWRKERDSIFLAVDENRI